MEIDAITKSMETMFDVNSIPVDPEARKKEIALREAAVKEITVEIASKNKSFLIEEGMDMFHDMKALSKETQSARMYEVTINLMKTLIDANDDYIKKEERDNEEGTSIISSTNVLITTTEDVIERILNKQKVIP